MNSLLELYKWLNYKISQNLFLFFSLAILLIGSGYALIVPIFEGFDETAHFSRVLEISSSRLSFLKNHSYIHESIFNYKGPSPYNSGNPPFDHEKSYRNFFSDNAKISFYEKEYRQSHEVSNFIFSPQENWEYQHPPLYYLILAPFINFFSDISLLNKIILLRILSFLMALGGILFAYKAIKDNVDSSRNDFLRLGFLVYPAIFPMFFLEFSRLGNDSLALFFSGILFLALSEFNKDPSNLKKSSFVGFILGLGLLTKALFVPILLAILFFYSTQIFFGRSKKPFFKGLLLILLMTTLTAGGWYLYKYLVFSDIGAGIEALQLNQQGGLVAGLKEHFAIINFLRALIVPIATFSWAGSWSLTRMPIALYVPLICISLFFFLIYFLKIKRNLLDSSSFLVWLFLFFYAGLTYHILITIALGGVATSPGWYLHVLFPWIACALGLSIETIFNCKRYLRLFYVQIIYAALFHIFALWFLLSLYSGCSIKGDNKHFQFDNSYYCLDQFFTVLSRANLLNHSYFGLFLIFIGFFIYAVLLNVAFRKRVELYKN